MKHIVLVIFFCFQIAGFYAQSGGGFSRLYTLGDSAIYGSHFSNLLVKGDTIVAFGNSYTTASLPYIAVALTMLDSFGNILDRNFFHLANDHLLAEECNDIVRRSVGGYAVISTTFIGHQASTTFFNEAGEVTSNKIYSVDNILTMFARRILEMSDGGLLIGGFVQNLDYSSDNFIKRVGPAGNKVWSRIYGEAGKNDILQSLIKTDDNNYVIGGGRVSPQGTPLPASWGKSWIFAIDSMGVMKWEWFSPLNAEVGAMGLQQTKDNGWIYLTATHEIVSPDETGNHIKAVRRDSSFNLIWEKVLSPLGPAVNRIGDLVPTPDGNWVASGTWAYKTGPGQDDITFYNCLIKMNDQGDTLWTVRLKSPLGYDGISYPGGLTVMPSGSVVWALRYDRYEPSPAQSFGWLIKVDNDGCVDTLCQTSGLLPELPDGEAAQLRVYPNPASTQVTFDLPELSNPALLSVFDVRGNLLWVKDFRSTTVWNTEEVSAGLYFYTLTSDGFEIQSGKVVVMH